MPDSFISRWAVSSAVGKCSVSQVKERVFDFDVVKQKHRNTLLPACDALPETRGQEEDGRKVLVLSYPQYCRYRSVLARLSQQPSSLLIDHTVLALGGIAALGGSTRILYCRDTFEHPALLQNESICDEFDFQTLNTGVSLNTPPQTALWLLPAKVRARCRLLSLKRAFVA
ncbi:unnamed protein product [Pleuronectes platessa]|uniref:Uncharacterized protein n=1 Tax=Pleuronectes platessa TaxID=8262 RepID=A0A9N7YZT5_PLEPL|nr:unnamed protein product [Pleuronectes platessa]